MLAFFDQMSIMFCLQLKDKLVSIIQCPVHGVKNGDNTRTAPRLPCLVFHWAKCGVWYFIHLGKYALPVIGWHYSRYRNKEWLKLEGTSAGQEMFGSTLYLIIFYLSLFRNSLFIHAGLQTFLSALFHTFDGMEPSLTGMKRSFNMKQISWALLPSKASSPETFFEQISEDAKVCTHKIHHCELVFHLPFCSQVPELQPRLPLTFRFIVGVYEVHQNSASCLEHFMSSVIQESPGVLIPVVLSLQEINSQFTFSLN